MAISSVIVVYIIGLFLSILIMVAGDVFLGLAIYNHAKSRGDQNAVLWGLLSGFLSVIGAVIYAIVISASKKPQRICMNCGVPAPDYAPACPNCGHPLPVVSPEAFVPDAPQCKKRFKGMLIGAIASVVLGIIVLIASILFFVFNMVDYGVDQYDHYPYSDYFHYNDNYDNHGNHSYFPDL
ncbi:MAG: zinc-ribbon domain-containing protein [Clostridiales bacterium]|nr:zinc-ribbon domain-containing protein [Clostridiales bacterium]